MTPRELRPVQFSPTAVVLLAIGFFSISFNVLLPVVPVLVERIGRHGSAGAATATLFIAMVCGEFVTPWLMSKWSPAKLLIAGELLLAFPSVAYVLPRPTTSVMLAAAGIRGLGTGVAVVVSVTLVTKFAESDRRGRAIGYAGLATGVPTIIFPSVGVWLVADNHSDVAAFIAFSAAFLGALLGLALRSPSSSIGTPHTNLVVAVRRPGILAVFVSFALASCAYGGVVTYVPIALPASGLGSAALFLLTSAACRSVSRWLSGLLGDRYSAMGILVGGLGLAAPGLIAVAIQGGPPLLLSGAVAYGLGYGAIQTGAYLLMVERSPTSAWGVVSALWNSAIDMGSAAGGALLGLSAALYGYSRAFWLMPVVLAIAVPLVWYVGGSVKHGEASSLARS